MYVKGRSGPLGVTAPLVFWGSNRKIMVGFSWPSLMETQTNQRNSGKLLFSKKIWNFTQQLRKLWRTTTSTTAIHLGYPLPLPIEDMLHRVTGAKKNDSSKKFLPSAWIWYQNQRFYVSPLWDAHSKTADAQKTWYRPPSPPSFDSTPVTQDRCWVQRRPGRKLIGSGACYHPARGQ